MYRCYKYFKNLENVFGEGTVQLFLFEKWMDNLILTLQQAVEIDPTA